MQAEIEGAPTGEEDLMPEILAEEEEEEEEHKKPKEGQKKEQKIINTDNK